VSSNPDEVLQKLNRIENLLERQGHLLEHRLDHSPNTHSSVHDHPSHRQLSSLNSSPWTEIEPSHLETTELPPAGSLHFYGNGYERFVPGIVVADGEVVDELIQSTSVPCVTTNFPFTEDLISIRQALLDSLPSFRHCDELKNVFFEVFSPVS
jgi:hypothetical protein